MRRHTYRGEAQRKAICTASGFPTEVHAGRAADYLKSPKYLWATVRSHFWFECGMPGRYCHFPDHSTGRVRYTGSSTTPEYISTFPPSPRRKRSVTCFFVLSARRHSFRYASRRSQLPRRNAHVEGQTKTVI